MLVLVFSVTFTLAILITTTATSHNGVPRSEKPTNAAVFGAIGTIIGYFGIEIGSDSLFERLLWPTRFYNSSNPFDLFQLALFTPMGGPLLRPAVRIIDEFIAARMHKGKRQGDPLGTALFSNLRCRYILHAGKGSAKSDDPDREFRNFIWLRVLRLVSTIDVDRKKQRPDTEVADCTKSVSALRAVYFLELSSLEKDPKKRAAKSDVLEVSNDAGKLKARNVAGVMCSELVAFCTGSFVAVHFRSYYAVLFFLPLAFKIIGLGFFVRRQSLNLSGMSVSNTVTEVVSNDNVQILELNRERDTDDFILIRGSKSILFPLSRHYGHPLRDENGYLSNDRANEVVSMVLVFAFAMIFPVSLFASIWASEGIQQVWLGYEVFATISMYAFRYLGREYIGSTESLLARGLQSKKRVALMDDNGGGVVGSLQPFTVASVEKGRKKVTALLRECK